MTRSKRQFKIIIEQDEDGFLIASVPALPGCYTQAKSFPVLTKRVREAIALSLEVAKDDPQYRSRIKLFTYEPTFVGIETIEV